MPINLVLDKHDQVCQVGCGLEYSSFLSGEGHVFTCGEGEFGQLGLGYDAVKEYRPVKV